MALNLRPVSQTDFSGGMNAVVNPFLISQRQVAFTNNMVLDEHGALRTRDGYAVLTTSPDLTSPIILRGNLVKSSGQEFPFAIQSTVQSPGTVGFDTTTGANKTGTSGTMSMTLGGSATLLLVMVCIDANTGSPVSAVTYDGNALTKIGVKYKGYAEIELWGLLNPSTGSPKTISVTLTAAPPTGWRMQGMSFTAVSGWGTAVTASGSGGTPSVTVSSDTNHMVVGVYAQDSGTSDLTPNKTSIYESTYGDNNRTEGQRAAGAASITLTYTGSIGPDWAFIGVDLIPTGTGYTFYETDTSPWTVVGSVNTENLPDAAGMIDKAVIIHGYASPKLYDGSSLTPISAGAGQTVPPGAKHGIFHLGALWLLNTNPTTTTLDGPSSLRASDANDPNSWPNANQTFIARDDGQVGMGLASFTIVETGISPTATLIAFKNYSTYQVTGVFGASNFSLQPIKSDMGCTAPRSVQFVSGFGIIRFTHKGFALYNGVEDRLISEEVRPLIFGGEGYTGLDFTNVGISWASQAQNPPLYIAAMPLSGSGLTRLFVYDLVRRGWTMMDLPVSLSTMKLFLSPLTSPVVHAGTTSTGQIIRLFAGDMDDAGIAIEWTVSSKRYFSQNQMQLSFWRRAVVDMQGEPTKHVTIVPWIDGIEHTGQEFVFPDGDSAEVRGVFSPDLIRTAHDIQLIVSGTGKVKIRGIELHASNKPLTRFLNRG